MNDYEIKCENCGTVWTNDTLIPIVAQLAECVLCTRETFEEVKEE